MHNEVRRRYTEPAVLKEIEETLVLLDEMLSGELPNDLKLVVENLYSEVRKILAEIEGADDE